MALTAEQQKATDLGRKLGLLKGNETATGGLLAARLKDAGPAMQEKYNKAAKGAGASSASLYPVSKPADFDEAYYLANNADVKAAVDQGIFSSGYDHFTQAGKTEGRLGMAGATPATPATDPGAQYENGAMPLHIEPLNAAEKAGLSTYYQPGKLGGGGMADAQKYLREAIADPSALAAKNTNPMATQFMGAAGDAAKAGIQGIGFDEVEAARNPYAGAMHNRLSETGAKAKAALLGTEGTRGARSFGDTATGTRLGALDAEMLSKGLDIDYQTYGGARAGLEAERNRSLSGAGIYGNLAGGAQGITDNASRLGLGNIGALFDMGKVGTDVGYQAAQNQITAGNYVRNYNQGVADVTAAYMMAQQQYPQMNLANTLGLLQQFQSDIGRTPATPTTLGQIGAGLQYGAGVYNSMPSWQAAGQQVYSSPTAVGPYLPNEYGPWPAR